MKYINFSLFCIIVTVFTCNTMVQGQTPLAPASNYGNFLTNSYGNNNISIGTLPNSTGKLLIKADTYWWDYLRFIPGGRVNEGWWLFHNPREEDKLHIGWHTINPSKEYWNLSLTRDAKVGINEIDPKAYLDVNGSVLIHEGNNTYLTIGYSKLIFGSEQFKITAAFNGNILANEIEVSASSWSDYVFNKDYTLMPISELEKFINANQHLPGIPTEKDITEGGLNLGEMDALLLQKIEELTLYTIELKKEIDALKAEKTNSSDHQ